MKFWEGLVTRNSLSNVIYKQFEHM